ncbi:MULTISPECIES: phosphonate C-P lyase system protein PhnL [Bacillus]|uniref:Phosphonate ABC transporter ATP-binding protein n=2 Tax=Bacillus TaxID=1386 RepID=A0A0M4G0Y2_9BACI|nr:MULTISPECIES: phosphonate C-P lyase system protein PhnL [Bacillus]ALC83850.1 phosphonate ABC transporter ATP-binding protein [Bacillus gobiensis]MBP1083113.1 alpha-D-ribose 1-methylphosphonate 5-triphosphate synthase subunit PhnL [Bacillus capparidis]MED1097936.1 phosphonate C-P lyase system protein PhnL [Bacillus capparidis]
MSELLKIDDLKKTFTMHQSDNKHIVGCNRISFILNEGEFIGITGRSGAGKSTVLKSIYRTYIPTGGSIVYRSEQFGSIDLVQATEREIIAIRKKEIGYVSQFLNVMPRVTALELVTATLIEIGERSNDAVEQAKHILAHFKLPSSLWDSYPRTFSGGEKLRLNLAQAMVKRPKLLLLDEPTASLDEASKIAVKDMIIQLKEEGTSMIGIFHDLDFMETVVDCQYNLSNGSLSGGHSN